MKQIIEMILKGCYEVAKGFSLIVWYFRRQLWFLTLVMIAMYLPLLVMNNVVFAPKAQAELNDYTYTVKPTTEHQQIIDYIYDTFGKDANNAFKVLSCENHSLKTDAQNYNSDGSMDIGVMQINSVHGVPAQYLYDWHSNIAVGYHIFKDSGWGAWTCSYMLK